MATLIADLARALPAALVAGVLPGYFWAAFVTRTDGLAERLTYSAALSMASVPAIALLLAGILHTGVTLGVALAAIVIVAGSGALACRLAGTASGPTGPVLPRPRPIRDGRILALLVVAAALALAVALGMPAPGWLLIVILAVLAVAGLATRVGSWRAAGSGDAAGSGRAAAAEDAGDGGEAEPAGPRLRAALRAPVLAVVLALTAIRAYTGVVWHDWPYLRGQDMFSHALMTEQVLAHGSYGSYLIYPPGFSAMSAVVCRLAGLAPLSLFPVLAPAFLLLTTLAAYTLATRLWGWDYGLAAAVLSGLVLVGPYVSFSGGLYPDLLSAFFLMVMVVAALVTLFRSPSVRSGILVAVLGAAVVLYHSVGSLYLVLLLAGVVLVCLPYLLLRGREGRSLARALVLTLAALGALSVIYAWHIYGLGGILSQGAGTRTAVGIDVGTQSVLKASDLLHWVGAPVIWLGVLGFAGLAVSVRYLKQPGQVLSALTILMWCVLMYAGSRTSVDGFPQRFERDVGGPLTILAALSAGLILQSLMRPSLARAYLLRPYLLVRGLLRVRPSRRTVAVLSAATALIVLVSAGVQAVSDMVADSATSREVTPRGVATAGAWLHRHNTGGTIISTPDMNRGITNRAVLAMGGYTGLQSYPLAKIEHPRSLPTAGRKPLLDSREVLTNPATCRAANILATDDVRYIVLYRRGNEANFAGFRTDPALYRPVFKNPSVVIYAPQPTEAISCGSTGSAAGSTGAAAEASP